MHKATFNIALIVKQLESDFELKIHCETFIYYRLPFSLNDGDDFYDPITDLKNIMSLI